MSAAPLPSDELPRLASLLALEVLDTPTEAAFDAITQCAALICEVPIALISLVDEHRQWFKSRIGLLEAITETPRDAAFCAHTILSDQLLEIPDAMLDSRFVDNPLVCGYPNIRFYAGFPIILSDGARVGTVCVIDQEPRQLDQRQRDLLQQLANTTAHLLESRLAKRSSDENTIRFRALSDASPHGVFLTDPQGLCTYTNSRWQEIFGLSYEQSLGDGWVPVIYPDDLSGLVRQWQHTVSTSSEFEFSFRICHPDGDIRYAYARARPLTSSNDELLGFIGSVEDITRQQQLIMTLAHNEQRQRISYERSPAMLVSTNAKGEIISISDVWLRRMEYSREEVIGRSAFTFLSTDFIKYAYDVVRPALLKKGACENITLQLRTKNDIPVDVLLSAIIERDDNGKFVQAIAYIEDVTEKRRVERALDEKHRSLSYIIDATNVGTWEWNVQTRQCIYNARLAQMFGYTLEDFSAQSIDTWLTLVHPDDRAQMDEKIQMHLSGETEYYECELRLRHRDGHWVWVLDRGKIMTRSEDGQPQWLYGIHLEITDNKQREQQLQKSQSVLNRTGKAAGIGGWEVDIETSEIHWADVTCQIHGVPVGYQPSLEEAIAFYAPEARETVAKAVEHAMATGQGWDLELPFIRANGERIWVRAIGEVEFENGQPQRLVGAFQDVTERRALMEQLAEQHEMLRVTLDSIADAVISTDVKANVRWMNPMAELMTGWNAEQALGKPLAQIFHTVDSDNRQPLALPILQCLHSSEVISDASNALLISRDNNECAISETVSPIHNEEGEVVGAVLVFRDVTEQRRISSEMSYRAKHDPLTDLINRHEFESRLTAALKQSHENDAEHALLFIDLDQFKLVNDACGHSAGDLLLQQVSSMLKRSVRAHDTVARLGGDEFGILLENCPAAPAQRVAQMICERMDDFRFIHDDRRFRIGTSIGLVPINSGWKDIVTVLQAADTSCYTAKEAGRNRVHTWYDSDNSLRERHGDMEWAPKLELALDENQFKLFVQKIVPINPDDEGIRAEVLLRLPDKDGKIIPPGAFLPAAERFNLISRIDRWVLRATLQWMNAQASLDTIESLSINLSGQSIGDRAFHRWALQELDQAGQNLCKRLCFEVTETAAVTNMADATIFIEQVRKLNVRVALDDFGAGASSFGYLKSLPVDYLKIDGQFIRDVITDPLDDAAVRCFADVAKVIGVKTVAEFVDNEAVLARLGEIGIDLAQGYLLHKPAPIDTLIEQAAVAVGRM